MHIAVTEHPWCALESVLPDSGPCVLLKTGQAQGTSLAKTERWSMLGWDPWLCWTPRDADPLAALDELLAQIRPHTLPDVPCPLPLLMGALSYDIGRHYETISPVARDDLHLPDAVLYGFRELLVADEVTRRCWRVHIAAESGQHADIAPCPLPAHESRTFNRETYLQAVESIRAMIAAGDCYQVNLSQRFVAPTTRSARAIFAAALAENPAPMMALVDTGAWQLVSTSPERLVQWRGSRLQSEPIKGTAPRDADPACDAQCRAALRASEKNRAELAMIVDLIRNDLGRVAQSGSVVVDEPCRLESYANVHHLVARIGAQVRDGATWAAVLRAMLPGGSVTGCPKIQAMRVIEQLEPVRRGFYCGAIGYLDARGGGDWNVAIRTLLHTGDSAVFHLGGGVVTDSDPQAEYEETLQKGATLFAACLQPCENRAGTIQARHSAKGAFMNIDTTPELVQSVYTRLEKNVAIVRKRLGRPLTLTEKILYGHLADPVNQEIAPGKALLALRPDRVAMQDATAQMALLQFLLTGKSETAVPTTVHCDHLIAAQKGASEDMRTALRENNEVYAFLESCSQRCGIGFWAPGAGIIHQVVLEQYAFPGGLMIGTDSHTPNAGGLGMIACGVGGADAVDVMVGMPWEVLCPKLVGVHLTGSLTGWTAPKDVILKVCELLTTKGGTNRIVEYFGPGAANISCTGKGTITNMGAELGATTSIFPFDPRMYTYLKATRREALAQLAEQHMALLTADPEVEQHPEKYFDQVIAIDLATLEPHIVGPHSPDVAHPISRLKKDVQKEGYPDEIKVALIGSCTNSSYEDLERAADVARQAKALGVKAATKLMVTPGSEQIHQTIQRDGQMQALADIGGLVLANACGPCIGQWRRADVAKGETNSILSSYNRNFPKRNDGSAQTLAFIGSPEIVVAMSLAGRLSFDPLHDTLPDAKGNPVKLKAPAVAPEVPPHGFIFSRAGYVAPPAQRATISVAVDPKSDRLQVLAPFPAWNGSDFTQLPLLLKAKGKCTTDHISQAGPWLKYRGHLENISNNTFLGAINAFTGEAGAGKNLLTGAAQPFPEVAKYYKQQGLQWVVVGDENYGEGSSREHAAMSPRFLGCAAVIVRSFARIHETNLKKQGVLPLTFVNPADYDNVQEDDRVSIAGLQTLAPGQDLTATLHHTDGSADTFPVRHTLVPDQIAWFRAGSALNKMRAG